MVYQAPIDVELTGWPRGRAATAFVEVVRPATATGFGPLPAFIDFPTGRVTPLGGPFLEQSGRNQLLASVSGPFLRVTGGGAGSCVNVRVEPSLAAAVVGCYADGVLLQSLAPQVTAEGKAWKSVRTPDRKSGYASSEFLAR